MKYALNVLEIEKLVEEKGFRSINALTRDGAVHRNTLHSYLTGERSPICSTVQRLADLLGVDVMRLISPTSKENLMVQGIQGVLSPFLFGTPNRALALFGSRARGRQKQFSDIDLGITGGAQSISSQEFLKIKTVLDDAVDDYPVVVDLVNLDAAPRWFLSKVDSDLQFIAGNEKMFYFLKGVIYGLKKTYKN